MGRRTKATSDRGHSLDSALEIARKFWQQLDALMLTLAELQDTLAAQPPPAAQPRAIQAQQVALQEIRHEIDHTKPDVSYNSPTLTERHMINFFLVT